MTIKRTKVVFIIPHLGKGGTERVLALLLEHLDRNKIEPCCIFYESKHIYKIPADVKIYYLELAGVDGFFNKIIYAVKRVYRLNGIIRTERPEVIFSFLNGVNLLVILASILSGNLRRRVKLLISERTSLSIYLRKRDFLLRLLIMILYRKADKIIANSNGVKKDLISYVGIPEEKICVIYNPIDIESVEKLSYEEVTEHPWFNENIPVVINVGALTYPKAQEYLLKAFYLARKRIKCRLVILGEGEKEDELKRLALDLRITDDAAFLGFKENPFKFMRKSAVFVLSSRFEGFPNVLLEAMACGVPAVSTRCKSGPEEIITDSVDGLLVPVENEEKLAEAIIKVITNPDLSSRFAAKAKETVSKFDVRTNILNYERLLTT